MKRFRLTVRGAVQGVGFRPFVLRLARELGLGGWTFNFSGGVIIEAEGGERGLEAFRERLASERPAASEIKGLEIEELPPVGATQFEIRESAPDGAKSAWIVPDLATCPECLRELFDPSNRRHLYPFINCTHCGPRFSIIEALPYDRPNTTMREFAMCPECEREYHNPADRRFHAQPNACAKCGPHLELWDSSGQMISGPSTALRAAAESIRLGQIVALKGIGGFQLLVDARDENAVRRLRERKKREEKPFAVLFPSLASLAEACRISELEKQLLTSRASSIVLLERLAGRAMLAPAVAPGNPNLGAMLPYSPLHHLLARELPFPVVATSGNLSDEPICIDEREAASRLRGIADVFLVHNRKIARHMDDSVARVLCGAEAVLRAGRGYAPLSLTVDDARMEPALAVGAHLKNTVALGAGGQIFLSQHIGDLETQPAFAAFQRSAADLPRLYDVQPRQCVCDLHPEYLSTKFAARQSAAPMAVQHHYAHALACLADNGASGPALCVCWDGAGWGTDNTIWGGEFLLVNADGFERFAHLRTFRLAGGDVAARQPRRAALGIEYEIGGGGPASRASYFTESERRMLERMLVRGINAPLTSSAGRLFDAVASLIGTRQRTSFEGQAAMELEYSLQPGVEESYGFELRPGRPAVIDWERMIRELLDDAGKLPAGVISAKFHNTLTEMIVETARAAGERTVALSGGCFQNKYLTERAVRRLREESFAPLWHRRLPPNDGGIAAGQILAAWRARRAEVPEPEVAV